MPEKPPPMLGLGCEGIVSKRARREPNQWAEMALL
jgi:hypothetical protein